MSGVTVSADGVVTGNTYDKYGSGNAFVRHLMRGFEAALDELLDRAAPSSLLDVGCGEGVLLQRWARRLGDARVVGIDLQEESLQDGWSRHGAPNLEYRAIDSERLPFGRDEFDLTSAIEVLEHVPDPEQTLAEMARCARQHLLVSVPREPLWRALNVARGAYLSALGNTPGHLNHWSKRSFVRLLSRHGDIVEVSSPFPWTMALSASSKPRRSYGSGARILSIGIACTGLLTLAYFSISSHVLSEASASQVALLWSVMFVIISVIYRPIEQLLSRTIAERRARGQTEHPLRVPIGIQLSFALLFLTVALALRGVLVDDVFESNSSLYDVLLVGTLAYAASYFARGWLAGHEYFALYGGLVMMEALSRLCFALAVAVDIASGETAVALGIAAAPLVSLVVVPAAFIGRGEDRREAPAGAARTTHRADTALAAPITADEAAAALAGPGTEGVQEAAAHDELSLRRGTGFAGWVAGIMLSEQTLLNAAVLTVAATSYATEHALAGVVFDVMLIARAPLQLFQAIQTSLLPHLTGLEATEGHQAFSRAIRTTVLAIAVFAAAVAVGLLTIGPFVMEHLFGQHHSYNRFGLALVGVGMGLHLVSGALNQANLARNRARAAALCWALAALVFLAWMLTPVVSEQLLRTEIGYAGATALLAVALTALYRSGAPASRAQAAQAASTERAMAR